MPVSVLLPPEAIWGYEKVTERYDEKPAKSWDKIMERVRTCFPGNDEKEIIKLIGKRPV